jgi:hypothetical protein
MSQLTGLVVQIEQKISSHDALPSNHLLGAAGELRWSAGQDQADDRTSTLLRRAT